MVRFIAAITVVTVCCCSTAVQAQSKPPVKRPVAPVSRARIDDAPSREQTDIQNTDLDQGIKPLSPELERLLIDWAASSEKIQRLEGEHLRRVYDMVYEIEVCFFQHLKDLSFAFFVIFVEWVEGVPQRFSMCEIHFYTYQMRTFGFQSRTYPTIF